MGESGVQGKMIHWKKTWSKKSCDTFLSQARLLPGRYWPAKASAAKSACLSPFVEEIYFIFIEDFCQKLKEN
jgi:hypothetical protein